MKRTLYLLPLVLLTVLLLSFGCGGAGGGNDAPSPATRGAAATFTIVWPDPSRLVPIASKAVQIDVLQNGKKVATKVGVRGLSTEATVIRFDNIPAGKLTFEATALPSVNLSGSEPAASGVPQANGSAPLTTEVGKTARVSLTMASTIVRLAVFPNPWKLEKL